MGFGKKQAAARVFLNKKNVRNQRHQREPALCSQPNLSQLIGSQTMSSLKRRLRMETAAQNQRAGYQPSLLFCLFPDWSKQWLTVPSSALSRISTFCLMPLCLMERWLNHSNPHEPPPAGDMAEGDKIILLLHVSFLTILFLSSKCLVFQIPISITWPLVI